MRQITLGVGSTMASTVELNCRDRRLLAFARTAANIAGSAALPTVLDELATEIRSASNVDTVLVMANDIPANGEAGEAPLIEGAGDPSGLRPAVAAAYRLGAPFLTVGAGAVRGPRTARNLAQLIAADERFAPVGGFIAAAGWETLVAVPLIARQRPLGVLLAWYPAGRRPGDAEVSFLTAMGDQAAVAINTARLERC